MKITMTSTETLTDIDGVPVRLWEGVTEGGVACKVFVHRLAVHKDDDASAFERELQEKLPPSRGRLVPLSAILGALLLLLALAPSARAQCPGGACPAPRAVVAPTLTKQWVWLTKQGCWGWGYRIAYGPHAGLWRIDPGSKRYPSAADPAPERSGDVRQAFLAWLNGFRAQHGLRPLGYDGALEAASVANSTLQAARRVSGHYAGGGFQVAFYGPTTLDSCCAGWVASPAHRAILLTPGLSAVGLGVVGASWTATLR